MFTPWITKLQERFIETVVVKKVLPALDQEEKKLFYKEVALLNGLNHPNIVKMKGVCQNPLSIMLEYCYFDFKPFGEDLRVTSLSGFLLQINEYKCQGFSFRKLQIFISQTTDFHFANYRFSFRKLQILISFRSISFRSISFRSISFRKLQ